jgi:Cytochrome oxidase complex assembly protein 1
MTDSHPPPIPTTELPAEIDRWNWGAFLLNWIWGIGNNTFIALLTFIPFFGLAMPFVLGAKGSRWAWRNGRWDSIAHFKRVQRLWAIWGAVIWLGAIALFGGIFGLAFYLLKNSEAYQLAVSRLQANTVAVSALGAPISTGTPSGEISTKGASGEAKLNFSVTGTKAKGELHVEALKKDGVWSLTTLKLKIDGRDDVIDLLKDSRVEMNTPAGERQLAMLASGISVLQPHFAESPFADIADGLNSAGFG